MTQLLEAGMLLCFGCSWPMSLYKNYRAKSAQSMSIHFILLIILGYICGIAAKLVTHNVGYVLIVYLLNLFIVSLNLVVYFINRRYDRAAEQARAVTSEPAALPITAPEMQAKMECYKDMNKNSLQNGVVFFGANYFDRLPLGEQSALDTDMPVYNRSIAHLHISQVGCLLESCILDLNPSKIFINIGDEDIASSSFDIDTFIEQYEWMLYTLHSRTDARIYIVSIISPLPVATRLNHRLETLARDTGCTFLNAAGMLNSNSPISTLFSLLRPYVRTHDINFASAMRYEG